VTQSIDLRRRGLLRASGVSVLSASTVALLAGCEKMAVAQSSNTANDVGILNTALGLENEAISAYQLGAASGLLQKPVLEVAVLFQTHHKEHRDALIAANAYIGVIPSFGDRALAQVSARLAADEAMHWTVLTQVLKDPLPAKALSFGA